MQASIATKQLLLEDEQVAKQLERAVESSLKSLKAGGCIWWCGNGGSAADAQHLAAELSGRFYLDRRPLFSEALNVNTSYLTAVANDYSYEEVYARLMEAKGREGDVLFALSTSGNSENILRAVRVARQRGVHCIALTGKSGGKLASLAHSTIKVPSTDTPRIQEAHIMLGHIICELVEAGIVA